MFRIALCVLLAALVVAQWSTPCAAKKRAGRAGELERLGPNGRDILVVRVDTPGFAKLPLKKRILAYYLSRAAIAGNDIHYQQNHRHALAIKRMLEQIFIHSKGMPKPLLAAAHDYLKTVWIHHGQYDHWTGAKFVPRSLTPAMLFQAAALAQKSGARFDFLVGRTLAEKLAGLQRAIFDKGFEPQLIVTRKGVDIVKESAVNFFDPGVTMALLKQLPKAQYDQLNVRFALSGGKLVRQVYRIGGLYDKELRAVAFFLRKAAAVTDNPQQQQSLLALVAYLQGGDEALFRKHSVHWLKSDTDVDYLAGFIEQLKDPRGIIGSWEGMVSVKSDSKLIEKIADNAPYFEKRMPWPTRYQRTKITRPVSNVVDVLVGTGDLGPLPWGGYNLPNYADIRKTVGSKNVVLLNIRHAGSKRDEKKVFGEFYLPHYQPLVQAHVKTIRQLWVYLHEVIGHASGQPDAALKSDPRTVIGRNFSALEECRAELVALYQMMDPKLAELGAYKSAQLEAFRRAAYVYALQSHMIALRRIQGDIVKGAHARARHAIFNFIMRGGFDGKHDYGARVIRRTGDYFIEVTDPLKVRAGLAALLHHVQVIKSTGDAKQVNALFDRFGSRLDTVMRDNIKHRADRLNLPRIRAVVYPRLRAIRKEGWIVDVKIHFDEDLTAQQLRFSRLSGVTR